MPKDKELEQETAPQTPIYMEAAPFPAPPVTQPETE
jgi:hypothetical protein